MSLASYRAALPRANDLEVGATGRAFIVLASCTRNCRVSGACDVELSTWAAMASIAARLLSDLNRCP